MSWLLERVPDAERAAAAAVLARCRTVALEEGSAYSGKRLPGGAVLLVEEGLVLLLRLKHGEPRRMVLALAEAGRVLSPLQPDDRLEPLAASRLTAVSPSAMQLLLRIPGVAAAFVPALLAELAEAYESLGQFASVRHADRVRDKLVQLARRHGRVVPGGVRLDIRLTHELLGEMVGSARETVTWAIGELTREGFLRREGLFYRLTVSAEASLF